MKNKMSNEKNIQETNNPEVTIIDLDKLEDDAVIDYSQLSQEDSYKMDPLSQSQSNRTPKQSMSIVDRILKINWHLVLLLVFVFSVIFIIYRFKNWGTKVDLDNLGHVDDNYDIEVKDNILPLIYEGDAPAINDGVCKVVLFGNDTFAQNKGTSDDMANMIAELSGATVYNCAFTGSYLASTNDYVNLESDPMDAFNLYWLTTSYTVNNYGPYEIIFDDYKDKIPADAKETFETLCSIDFNTVDVIGIMYDANDYLAGKPLANLDNTADIHYFTGNLEASVDLIQQFYPHIRIILMSPTYAYAINEEGDYVSSDLYYYLDTYKLSLYALMLERSAADQGITFVDNIYGTINETNADQYLLDHISLNVEGRKKLAERFVYALTYYD